MPAAVQVGTNLPGLTKFIVQDKINLYARASRDFNPIHIDPDFAAHTPARGTIAHGMLILAYVSQMMTEAFGKGWLTGGKLNVRFKAPARPGDVITVSGKIEKLETKDNSTIAVCAVLCANQNGEIVITGEATARIEQK
jgi:acyl dehydratase